MRKLIILLCISCNIFAQNTRYIDSVRALTLSKNDTIRFWAYDELSWVLKETNKEEALKYSNSLLSEAIKSSKQKWIAQGYNDIGIIYMKTGDLNKALFNLEKSLAIREKIGNKKDIASSLSKIANVKTENGEYGKALEMQLKVLKLYEDLDIKPYIANTCNNIGQLYNIINKFEISNDFLKRAYDIEKEVGDVYGMPVTLAVIGSNYSDLQQSDSALMFLNEAKNLFKQIEDYSSYAIACNNIGLIYRKLKDSEKGKLNYQEAIAVSKQIGDSSSMVLFENNLANILIDEGKFDDAETILHNSLKISLKLGAGENVLKIYQSLTGLYIQKKDAVKADFYFDKYRQAKDSVFSAETALQFSEAQTKFDVEKKNLELAKNKAEIESEKNKRFITYGALSFFILLFAIAIWAFNQKRKSGKLLETKNSQLENANHEISYQKEQLSEKQKEIVDSINYAKKIQTALLASEEMLLDNALHHFILFKPKDIVSGDFTWATKINDLLYLACCDSTGHGVPGAFMSLLNIGFLSEAIKERHIYEPGHIFNYVRDRLIETIGKDKQQDGFDGILLCIDLKTNNITYAASNNAPLMIRDNETLQLKCNKMPVGKGVKTDSFDTFVLNHQKNDSLYLFTDGYPDQFGGPKGKKFKYKQLEDLLLQNNSLSLNSQKENLIENFEKWKGNLEQVDDVCIIGIKL